MAAEGEAAAGGAVVGPEQVPLLAVFTLTAGATTVGALADCGGGGGGGGMDTCCIA